MTRCLRDRTLLLLYEGEGSSAQRAHLKECEACAARYRRLDRDLKAIGQVLREEPPSPVVSHPARPFAVRWLPAAAALAMTLMLVWVGVRTWSPSARPGTKSESWSVLDELPSNPFLLSDALALELATEGVGPADLAAVALEAARPCEWYDLLARSEVESAIEESEISGGMSFPSCIEGNLGREKRAVKSK